ncbi:hypothetical protein, partial [Rouxiella sp. Mn2063]|uniref:hypothetical protein n=1 Tax=Rouxiella sp. Mn2063 TaxID=3395262 RepID=UPI003BE85D87
ADGSVGSPHVRVGNCQASNKDEALHVSEGLFLLHSNGRFATRQRVGQKCREHFCPAQRAARRVAHRDVGQTTARHQIKTKPFMQVKGFFYWGKDENLDIKHADLYGFTYRSRFI